jgi:hypothetical protein
MKNYFYYVSDILYIGSAVRLLWFCSGSGSGCAVGQAVGLQWFCSGSVVVPAVGGSAEGLQ